MVFSRKSRLTTKQKLWRAGIVVLLALAIVVFRLVEETGVDRRPEDRFVVVRAIDGDSVELAGGDRLRLLSVDTPEKGEPLYKEAKQFLETLTVGKAARLEYAGRRRDRYGRLLAYMYVDSLLVNKAILDSGLGYLYQFDDTDREKEETRRLLDAQRHAMTAKVGLWDLPREAESFYVASVAAYRFHRPNCRTMSEFDPRKHRRFDSRNDALYEGLSPCRTCRP